MNGDANTLFASVLVSGVGLGFLMYGRKQRKPVPLLVGVSMFACAYLIKSATPMLLAGGALCAVVWLGSRYIR